MKERVMTLGLSLIVVASGAVQALAAAGDIYKVGSWVTYKMSTKTEMVGGGAAGGANPMAGPDPRMLAMLPPDQRAKIEAQIKDAQAKQAAAMKGVPSAGAGGAGAGNDMMSKMDMRMKLSVVGEEKRGGKDCIWLEMAMSGKAPDMDAMAAGMMGSIPADKQAEVKASMAKAKERMKKMPMFTKDGHIKIVMKMLVEKPDPKGAIVLKPLEMWKKQGDRPAVKTTAEEIEKFSKGESDSSSKSKTHTKDEMEMHGETTAKANLMSDEKRAQIEETADNVRQAAKLGRSAAAVIPGGQVAAAGLGVLGEMSAMVSDVANMGVEMKAGLDVKMKSETSTESETKTTTKLVSTDAKVVGAEDIEVPGAGTVKAIHTQNSEVKERTQVTESKINAKVDMDVKADVKMNVGVDGGAQSVTGKAIGGLGKGIAFMSDPLGRKKKAAEKAQQDMNKQIQDQTNAQMKDMKTTNEMKTRIEETKDYWVSPEIPAMGLAKMTQVTEDKDTTNNTSMAMGGGPMQGMGDPSQMAAMNPMMGGMGGMGGAPKQPKPKTVMETTVFKMGTSGAKSEIDD